MNHLDRLTVRRTFALLIIVGTALSSGPAEATVAHAKNAPELLTGNSFPEPVGWPDPSGNQNGSDQAMVDENRSVGLDLYDQSSLLGKFAEPIQANRVDLMPPPEIRFLSRQELDEIHRDGSLELDGAGLNDRRSILSPVNVDPEASGGSSQGEDLGELSKQTNNPVGSLWLLFLQEDLTTQEGPNGENLTQSSLKFQPVMPMYLTEKLRLINRPVFSFVSFETPEVTPTGLDFDRTTGLGDTILLQAFTTSDPKSPWVWGVGPTWFMPTATDDELGLEQWGVGPVGTVFYMGNTWVVGVVAQSWHKIGGEDDRDSLNLMDVQYIVRYRITPTFQVGFGPNVQYDWDDDGLEFPIGFGSDTMFTIGKMPIRLGWELQYFAESDRDQEWNFRIFAIPIIPAPKWAGRPIF